VDQTLILRDFFSAVPLLNRRPGVAIWQLFNRPVNLIEAESIAMWYSIKGKARATSQRRISLAEQCERPSQNEATDLSRKTTRRSLFLANLMMKISNSH
jgi:hypothetical protein